MNTIIFATNNQNKVEEIRKVIGSIFSIQTLQEAGILIDIPEPYDTLQENASTKSKTIFELTHQNCFSEDTGLEVEALNGAPGVKSARYAGEGRNFQDNITKLLQNLINHTNRRARFRTVISLILNKQEYFFEGICEGEIITQQIGINGFGYDPIFKPLDSNKTFAEMTIEEKNMYSHRKKATQQLIDFLSQNGKNIS